MKALVAIAIAIAGAAVLGLYAVRGYPWLLAWPAGIAIGALAFVAMHNMRRLYRQLRDPALIVERSRDLED